MTRIGIKRVYEAADRKDGCRVLVDKFWPRGMRREQVQYDLWAKQLAPSDELRRWYHADPAERWEEFRRRYLAELRQSDAVREFAEEIKRENRVTLLFASRNSVQNHARVLEEYLQGILGRA